MRHFNLIRGVAISMAVSALVGIPASPALAACAPMQPLFTPDQWSVVTNGDTTTINTPPSLFAPSDSFGPHPTNLLDTVYLDSCDRDGNPIPNTLPSSPEHPYNLHPDPEVSTLPNKLSPTNDLTRIINGLKDAKGNKNKVDQAQVKLAIDILEGNPIDRLYSGFPVLHYNGPLKGKTVIPTLDSDGKVIGGTVDVHLIYYDTHIESDTSYIDPSPVFDVPWTVNYTVDILDRGSDDFAGYVMYLDNKLNDPAHRPPRPNVGLDNSFFPMAVGQDTEKGQRYVFHMKMAPGGYWNLTYHWGWRNHPPRVQVVENFNIPINGKKRNFNEFEAFCPTHQPNATGDCPELINDPAFKENAINMIGNVAPEKRMWNDMRAIKSGASGQALRNIVADLDSALDDWQHRTRLPRGVAEDKTADETLLFVNNTIYGHVNGFTRDDSQSEMYKYTGRGSQIKVKLLNGDFFPHAYVLVDFGGSRGWENTFHNTLPVGGQGPLFTFGRNHFWINTASGAIPIPVSTRNTTAPAVNLAATTATSANIATTAVPAPNPASKTIGVDTLVADSAKDITPELSHVDGRKIADKRRNPPPDFGQTIGEHNIVINFNYDPPRRIRMYQFDALHHDEGIWSPH